MSSHRTATHPPSASSPATSPSAHAAWLAAGSAVGRRDKRRGNQPDRRHRRIGHSRRASLPRGQPAESRGAIPRQHAQAERDQVRGALLAAEQRPTRRPPIEDGIEKAVVPEAHQQRQQRQRGEKQNRPTVSGRKQFARPSSFVRRRSSVYPKNTPHQRQPQRNQPHVERREG